MIKRLVWFAAWAGVAQAMVFDNRYLPLYLKPVSRHCDALSSFRLQPFFMRADRSFSPNSQIELPDMCGIYDQRVLDQALVNSGHEEILRSDFRLRSTIPWVRQGRLEAQGLAFLYEQAFSSWFSLGVSALFAHVSVRHEFLLTGADDRLPVGDKEYLFQAKEKINKELGLSAPLFSKTGFGDIDLYARFGSIWEYCLRCRRIDSSIKFGLLIPTAQERDVNNPASIPLGGNKHWGIYTGIEQECELKEDWFIGLMFRAIKRFGKTHSMRLPLLIEPVEYGALCGPVHVDPGWTFVFNPYFSLAGLREGLGVQVGYTLVAHLADTYRDLRAADVFKQFPSRIHLLEECSSWRSEHVTVGAYYDFAKMYDCPRLYPRLSIYWDIPVDWLVGNRAAKTAAVSLMVGFDF